MQDIELLLNPLPPVKNSLDFNIDDPEKPTSIYLFREDYAADNRISFQGKFRGRSTITFNSSLAVGNSSTPPLLEMINEAQINGPIGRCDLQFKLKPGRISAQLDLGHHLIANSTIIKNGKKHALNSFINPYLLFETDRVFHKRLLGLGYMITRGNFYKDNVRLNIRQQQGGLDWDVGSNVTLRSQGFFLSSLVNLNLKDGVNFNSRRFTLGYDRNSFNVNGEISFSKGSQKDWRTDFGAVSVAYDMRELGTFGLLLSTGRQKGIKKRDSLFYAKGIESFNGLDQFPHEPEGIASELRNHIKENFAFGYRNRLNRNLELKTKFSMKGPNALFLNYRMKENLRVQVTMQTLVSSDQKKGFLDLPFELGLKLKLDS